MRTGEEPGELNIEELLKLAKDLISGSDFTAARQAIRRIHEISPDHPKASELLQQIESREQGSDLTNEELYNKSLEAITAGNIEGALEILNKIHPPLDLDVEMDLPKRRPEEQTRPKKAVLVENIDKSISSGLYQEGLALIDSALLDFPRDSDFERLKEETKHKIDRRKQVKDLLYQGQELQYKKKYQVAINTLEAASQLDPQDLEVKECLIQVMVLRAREILLTDREAAEKLLQRVFSLDNENEEAKELNRLLTQEKQPRVMPRLLVPQSGDRVGYSREKPKQRPDGKPSTPGETELKPLKVSIAKQQWAAYLTANPKLLLSSVVILGVFTAFLVVVVKIANRRPAEFTISISSLPSGAKVYIDEMEKGITPLKISVRLPGKSSSRIRVKLSLEKHEDHEDILSLSLEPNKNYQLGPIPLKPINLSTELEEIYKKALQSFNEDRLLLPEDDNALKYVTQLIEEARENQNGLRGKALELRQQIKSKLMDQLSRLSAKDKKTERELALLQDILKVDPDDNEIRTRTDSFPGMIERLKKQIEEAISGNRLLPGESGNALDLLKRLYGSSPTRERDYCHAKRKEVQSKVRDLAREKCKTTNEECMNYVTAALKTFSNDAALKKNLENAPSPIKVIPPGQPHDDSQALIKQLSKMMEVAYERKQFVLPEKNNVAYYANEILKLDGNHPRAHDLLKNAVYDLALRQAHQLTKLEHLVVALRSRDDAMKVTDQLQEAKNVLNAIRLFWPSNSEILTQINEVDGRVKTTEQLLLSSEYHVIHSHNIGFTNCKGKLIISGHTVEYRAGEEKDSKDNFVRPFADFKLNADKKDELGFIFSERKWEFKPVVEAKEQRAAEAQKIIDRIRNLQKIRERMSQP